MQGQDADATEPAGLRDVLRERTRNRPTVRRILIEVAAPDEEVGRIRRLEYRDAARPEDPQGLVEDLEQRREVEVLDHVDADDGREARVREALQVCEPVGLDDVETARATVLEHAPVRVDAACRDPCVAEELEQLAPAAAEIDDGTRADLRD